MVLSWRIIVQVFLLSRSAWEQAFFLDLVLMMIRRIRENLVKMPVRIMYSQKVTPVWR